MPEGGGWGEGGREQEGEGATSENGGDGIQARRPKGRRGRRHQGVRVGVGGPENPRERKWTRTEAEMGVEGQRERGRGVRDPRDTPHQGGTKTRP